METISVIIPVYNVERYIDKCLRSVLDQSYKQLEVIIVDDGSTDNCPDICDNYAATDRRVKVIHQQNRGVSAARNAGIKRAGGNLITFVDADDNIALDMLRLLHETMTQYNADVSICGLSTFIEGQQPTADYARNHINELPQIAALKKLLYQTGISNAVFGKLYKKDLFASIEYNENISYGEDLEINYKLIAGSKRVITSTAKKYYYLQRQGSAMNSQFSKRKMDSLTVVQSIYKDTIDRNPSLVKSAEQKLFVEALFLIWQIPRNLAVFNTDFKLCKYYINKYKYAVVRNSDARIQHRLYASIAIINVDLLALTLRFMAYLKRLRNDTNL